MQLIFNFRNVSPLRANSPPRFVWSSHQKARSTKEREVFPFEVNRINPLFTGSFFFLVFRVIAQFVFVSLRHVSTFGCPTRAHQHPPPHPFWMLWCQTPPCLIGNICTHCTIEYITFYWSKTNDCTLLSRFLLNVVTHNTIRWIKTYNFTLLRYV